MEFMDEEFEVEDTTTESEVERSRELINLVRVNPHLYNKSDPHFCNTEFKMLSWATVGQELSVPMSGEEASATFYKLRQKFGKIRNKLRQSAPRSDAGAGTPSYKPDWELYEDLLFLADVIQPRERTSTNYSRGKMPAQRGVGQRPSAGFGVIKKIRTSTPTSFLGPQSEHVFRQLASSTDEDCSVVSDLDCASIELPRPPEDGKGQQKVCKKTVPEPDVAFKVKKAESEAVTQRLLSSSDNLSKLATSVGAALEKAVSAGPSTSAPGAATFASFPPGVQSLLGAVGFAITKVSDEDQLPCLIDVLQLIHSKYCKRGGM